MAEHKVKLMASDGVFKGLSKQNLLFHQCIQELVDNALAATDSDKKALITIAFCNSAEDGFVDLYVCDNGSGMDSEGLSEALQLGGVPASDSRLNEHGFGLKNSLAALSGGNGSWKLWTRKPGANIICVEGPFKESMTIKDAGERFPDESFLPSEISTLIKVKVKRSFIKTVQGQGAPSADLATLRTWLIEHLGVAYRGYLGLNPVTQDAFARIVIFIGDNSLVVPLIEAPFREVDSRSIDIELGGICCTLEYRYGKFDESKAESLVHGKKPKYYYQRNSETMGIDIRLGKRVIATKQFEKIWKAEDGVSQLARHKDYDDFLGELIIPELPRGVLGTVNNKTNIIFDDADWINIFDRLNEIRPLRQAPIQDSIKKGSSIVSKWAKSLKKQ